MSRLAKCRVTDIYTASDHEAFLCMW